MIPLRVREAQPLSATLKRFLLEPADGGRLPPAQPGAHALFTLDVPGRPRRNAYSLAAQDEAYGIVVRRVEGSRGGSTFLHDHVLPGHVLRAGLPQNHFPIPQGARRHVLFAGGIGVTPFLAYLPALARAGVPAVLHQFCRPEDEAAFRELLRPFAAQATIHAGGGVPDIAPILAGQPLGTHVSVCGPEPFMQLVHAVARGLGWPTAKLHRESFGAAAGGAPFVAVLHRSGLRVPVAEDCTLLEALEEAGTAPLSLCRGGVCGQCRVPVLAGVPDHRDAVLDPAEAARGDAMMACVSRARTPELVLDL